MKTVTLYTDGACSGNPGPGGWGAILLFGGYKRELSGGEPSTTNNRMELTAVIRGLEALKEPCIVELYSDSKYVIDALEKGWAKGWKARGWIKADKKPALNPDLWERLLELCGIHTVCLHWVKGHAENPYNNRCDEMAVSEWQMLKDGAHSAWDGTSIERKKGCIVGRFVIKKVKNGEYTFDLKAGNGEVILSASETYSSLDSCKAGVESVRKNCDAHVEDQTREGFEKLTHPKFELYADKAGEFRWRLKARNGENIGRSEGYKAKSSAQNGIASVGRNAADASVVVKDG